MGSRVDDRSWQPHAQPVSGGPVGEIVREALKPAGYDVRICYNCNRLDSPRYVAYAWKPRALTQDEIEVGDPQPPDGPVDFGITETNFLTWLYEGQQLCPKDGAQHQLRLLAMIEDPVYILVAVKAGSGIADLAQLAALKRPLRMGPARLSSGHRPPDRIGGPLRPGDLRSRGHAG